MTVAVGETHNFMALAHVMGMCFRCERDLVVTEEVLDLVANGTLVPRNDDGTYTDQPAPRRRSCCGGRR